MLKRLFQSKRYQPQARWGHSCVSVGTKAIVWGGMQTTMPEVHQSALKTKYTSVIEVFDLQTAKWTQERTVGNPPLGIRGLCYTTVGSDVYFFGGFCGHDWCRHNTVYCLDSLTNVWREVTPYNTNRGPMKKSRCGMFHFRGEDNNDYLCIINGTGLLCSANQTNATYLPWRENPDWGWTDEHHFLDLRNNTWIVPCMTGDIAPPCAGFTLTKISNTSAVFYGGYQPTNGSCLTDVYIVTVIDLYRVHWKKMNVMPEPGRPNDRSFPVGRQDHTLICLSSPLTGHDRTILLMMGGRDHGGNTLNDSWLLDIDKNMWTQVFLLESVAQRHFHSATSICLNSQTVLVLLFGGVREWLWGKPARQQPALTSTVILEASATPDGDWRLRVLMGETDTSPVDDYQNIIQQVIAFKEKEVIEDQEKEEEEQSTTNNLTLVGAMVGSQDELDTSYGDPLRPTSPSRKSQVRLSTPTGDVVYDIPNTITKSTTSIASSGSSNSIPQSTPTPSLTNDSPATTGGGTNSNTNLPTIEEEEESDGMIPGSGMIINSTSAINTIKELQRQLIIAQGRANDIEEVLHRAVMSAEDRAVKAEEKCRVTEGRLIVLEGQVKTFEELMKKSEASSMESKNELLRYSEQTVELEKQMLESENRAIMSEIALNEMEIQLAEQQLKLQKADEREKDNERAMEMLERKIIKMKEEITREAIRSKTSKQTYKQDQDIRLNHQHDIPPRPLSSSSSTSTITLSIKTDNGTFSQLQITNTKTLPTEELITMEEELKQNVTINWLEIANISKDITSTLVYLHTHQLRDMFHISLDPTCIVLIKREERYHAQLLVSITNDVSSREVLTEKEDSFQSDIKKFGTLLVTMATGMSLSSQEEDIDVKLAGIQCPKLVDFIHKCLNNEDKSITVETIHQYIETL